MVSCPLFSPLEVSPGAVISMSRAVISMSRFSFRYVLTLALATFSLLSVAQDGGKTAEPNSKFLPPSTALYLEVPNPSELLSLIFDHPLREKIESLEPYRAATSSQAYKRFLLVRTMFEGQVQMPWREALETFLAQGFGVGRRPRNGGDCADHPWQG